MLCGGRYLIGSKPRLCSRALRTRVVLIGWIHGYCVRGLVTLWGARLLFLWGILLVCVNTMPVPATSLAHRRGAVHYLGR